VAVDGSGLSRPLAGVGAYTRQILAAMALARPRHRLTVYVPMDAPLPEAAEAGRRRIPAVRLLGRHLLWPRALRRLGADAYFGPAGQLPLGDVGAPAVLTVHDLAIYRRPDWFPPRHPFAVRLVVPRSLRRAGAIIAVSHSTARDLAELFGIEAERVTVVHHGVAGAFRPLPPERRAQARRRFELPERFILFVGTIEPRKNLETLIEAWAQLPRRPDLVLAGAWGWRHESLRERLSRLGGQVHLLGAVAPEELPALYNLALCLAHPAWYEGFGLTPLEAMACGTPVVCSDAASLPEVVGEAALLVPPGDVQSWRAALERVAADHELGTELRRKGILRAAEFSWDRAAEQTWEIIERAADPGGSG
jgi:glycosyltransferase involved in cell wall biosynthesis